MLILFFSKSFRVSKFQSFKVSEFQSRKDGILDAWILGLLEFQSFKV